MFLYIVVFPLLIFASLHASVLAVHLANAPDLASGMFSPLALFASVLAVVYVAFKALRFKGSLPLLSSVLALCGIGIIVQFRIGTFETVSMRSPSQMALPLGVVAMLGAYWIGRRGRLAKTEPLWPGFLVLSVAVVLFVLIAGRAYRGSVILKGNINPVEIIKPMLVLFAAALLSGHRKLLKRGFLGIPLPPLQIITTIALFWLPPMAMLILQKDMGMFALMNFTLLVMLHAVTGRRAYLVFGLAAVTSLAAVLMPMTTRGAARLLAWRDPFSAATGAGWQPLQALVALYSGGVFGTGFGAGSPSVVPIVESDFAYVIIGEELGIAGCICIAALFVVMIASAARIAEKSRNTYCGTVAAGLAACLGFQTLLNIGGVVKAIPLTGIPLPLISHGGSSLATTLLMIGLLLAISDETPRPHPAEAPLPVTKPEPPAKKPRKSPPHPRARKPAQNPVEKTANAPRPRKKKSPADPNENA